MSSALYTLAHIGFGTATLGLFWATYCQVKGSPRHRRLGRLFVWSWVPVLASVIGVTILKRAAFTPPELVQFLYLTLCVVVVLATAVQSLRRKHDLDRFRGRWFRAGGVALTLSGLLVLAAGLASGEVLPVTFSSVGLIYGPAMLRFAWMRGAVHPSWPLIWHLNGMLYLFNAIHGTLLAVAWRALVAPEAGPMLNVATHVLTLGVVLALRLYWGQRRNAPLRFRPDRPEAALA